MNVPPASALSSVLSTAIMGEFALALSCPSNLCSLLGVSLQDPTQLSTSLQAALRHSVQGTPVAIQPLHTLLLVQGCPRPSGRQGANSLPFFSSPISLSDPPAKVERIIKLPPEVQETKNTTV